MRLWIIFVGLVMLVLVPFFIWGDVLTDMFSEEETVEWLREYGSWAWAAAILLLVADLFLPIPGTIVMSALGFIYGMWLGGLLATLGSFLSGLLAYSLCHLLGEKGAKWILGEKGYVRGREIFSKVGGWLVVLSRWLPVFPEVVACMAGLARMRFAVFCAALLAGSAPLGFVFAWVGHVGESSPVMAIVLSAGLPVILWLLTQPLFTKKMKSGQTKES